MPWAAVLLPLVGGLGVLAFGSTRRRAGAIAVTTTLATLAVGLAAAFAGDANTSWSWGPKLRLTLAADDFARIMVVLVPAIAAPVIAYAAATEEDEPAGLRRLLAGMVAFVGAMELLVLAGDLLTLLVGWELVAAFSWLLIAHHWRDPARPAAAREAFVTTGLGALGLYAAAGALFAATGRFDFEALTGLRGAALDVVAIGVLLAAAAKSAQLPFSGWLFAAMQGPTPVSALLHSATMVAAGAYAVIRLAPFFEPTGWFGPAAITIGIATVFAGGIVAATQSDIKRALAGSTSSQYGLMLLAAGAGSTVAAGAQLVTHAAFKSLLFLGAGVAIHAAATGELRAMRLGRALPRAAPLFGIGAAALAAVPPLGGAASKELVVAAASELSLWLGVVAMLSGGLTAFYAARLHLLAYGPGERRHVRGPDMISLASIGALAGFSVLLGVLWLPNAERVLESATRDVVPPTALWEFAASLAAMTLAAAAAWVLWRKHALASLGVPDRARQWLANWIGLPQLTAALVTRPVPRLAEALARFDERAVDAGVRAAARTGQAISRLFSAWGERGMDGLVSAIARAARSISGVLSEWGERGVDGLVSILARGTVRTADASGTVDDRSIDGLVEAIGRGVGAGGSASRRLQTGLAHQYYVILAAGALVVVAVALLWT